MQPLRGDPDNLLLEGTNATDKASTPRLGPPNRPGRRTTSAVFSPKGGPSPAAVSLLLLRAGDIETNPGPHCYACGNPVRHGTSPLRCSSTNCSTVSHKQFTCSGLHRSNLLKRWQCPSHGRATLTHARPKRPIGSLTAWTCSQSRISAHIS